MITNVTNWFLLWVIVILLYIIELIGLVSFKLKGR